MGRGYERTGKPTLPKWWTDLVFPMLEKKENRYEDIAERASEHAGRTSYWDSSSISKFKTGKVQTRELANGISYALGVPFPYFEARTPEEAEAFMAARKLYDAAQPSSERYVKLLTTDELAERERRSALDQSDPVPSNNERSTQRGRPRRSPRGRA